MSAPLVVVVNGRERALDAGSTVADLVAVLPLEPGRGPRSIAVERNGEIVSRSRWESTTLATGDRLEVVQLVQGG